MRLTHVAGLACLVCLALFFSSGPFVQRDSTAPVAEVAAPSPVVIVMIGDGMGDGLVEAASYYRFGAPGQLVLQNLPRRGRLATVGIDGVPDSAAAATASWRRQHGGIARIIKAVSTWL